jgi:TonB family protein
MAIAAIAAMTWGCTQASGPDMQATTAPAERAVADATLARDEARPKAVRRRAPRRTGNVEANVQPAVKVKGDVPVYPRIARAAGVEGTVTIAAAVDAKGNVTGTSVLRSVPLLNQAALDAVKEWQFQPQRVGGKAVPSMVTVNVNFVRS